MNRNLLTRVSFTVIIILFVLSSSAWTWNAVPFLTAPNDGAWTGTTSRNYPMSFTVSGSGTQWSNFTLKTDWSIIVCSGTLTLTVTGPGSITNDQFSGFSYGPTGTFSFTGQFTSPTTASGTYSFTDYGIIGCGFFGFFDQSGTWTAQGPSGPGLSTFGDVPFSYWAHDFIERLYNAGITGGCSTSPLNYCPEQTVTRAQMAVFLLRGRHGSSYVPPPVGATTGFGDVAPGYWSATFIKQLAAEGITTGCGNANYCPEHPVTRAQMAVFLLRSKHGASYSPPGVGAGTGFSDVPPDYWAAAWIKQLITEGITTGCGSGIYCPEQPVTRAQMAVFLVRTFSLP